MKRHLIAWSAALALLFTAGIAFAQAEPPTHLTVRCAGTALLPAVSGGESARALPADVSALTVEIDGVAFPMGNRADTQEEAFPFVWTNAEAMSVVSGDARILIRCALSYTEGDRTESIAASFALTPSDSNCAHTPRGVDLCITAEMLGSAIAPSVSLAKVPSPSPSACPTASPTARPTATPTASPTARPTATPTASPTACPTATPTVSPTACPTATPTVSPTACPTATPTAIPTPTATPTDNIPATGDVSNLWLVILLLVRLCAIAGIILLYVRRAHRP